MGLLTLTQIPCHHVLANEIALNLKYHIHLKHFFNINLGIGIIKNYFFCLYFWHISSCFYSIFDRESLLDVELNSAYNEYPLGILLIDPATPKIINTWKNVMMMSSLRFFRYFFFIITFFQAFLVFGVAGSVKSMLSEYSLDGEFNSASNDLSRSKFE